METALIGLAMLACPVGMGLMMWFMSKGMGRRDPAASAVGVEDLRAEHQRLGAEIQRLETGGIEEPRLTAAQR